MESGAMYWDNGNEHGNYYKGVWDLGCWYHDTFFLYLPYLPRTCKANNSVVTVLLDRYLGGTQPSLS